MTKVQSIRNFVICAGLLAFVGCNALPFLTSLPGGDDVAAGLLRAQLTVNAVSALEKPATNAAKARLGQALFFDKILGGNRDVSCATCHYPLAFSGDGLPLSKGVGGVGLAQSRHGPLDAEGNPLFIPRNAPDVFNRGSFDVMFWDGRVRRNEDGSLTTPAGDQLLTGLDSALAAQAMFPVTSRAEMRGETGENELGDLADSDLTGIWAGLMARVLAIPEYRDLFAAAYPGVAVENVTFAHAANAIAEFEIAHWTMPDSPFDDFLRGDNTALSAAALRGGLHFYGGAGCASCHSGPLLSDQEFHNRATPQIGPGKGHGADGLHDFGREGVSHSAGDRFRFRTPALRNVVATGPYMHSGAFMTLEAAVRHELNPIVSAQNYDPSQLPTEYQSSWRSDQTAEIVAAASAEGVNAIIMTDAEVADLVAFLESLTSPSLGAMGIHDTPASVPSGLLLAD